MSLQAEIAAGDPLKAFSSSLDALAGFGEELHLEARKTQLIMSALNMSMTGQALIRVSPRFFASYSLRRPVIDTPRGRVKGDSLTCRVLLKTLRLIFRKNQNIANSLERCEMNLTEAANSTETSRLHLKHICQNGVTKTHSLWYAETVPAQQLFSKDTQHQFTVEPGLIADFLHHFHPKITDVALEFTQSSVKVKSYSAETARSLHPDERVMHSEFTINSSAFESYGVRGSVQIAFNIKEFRTVLTYARELQSQLKAFFDEPGKPIVFSVQLADAIYADFAVMTHLDDPVESQLSNNLSGYSFRSGV